MAKVLYLWVDQELGGFNLGLVVPLDAGGRFLCTSRDGNGINSRHSMHHANSHGPMNHTFPFRLSTQQDVNSAVVLIPFRTRAQGSQDDIPLVSLSNDDPQTTPLVHGARRVPPKSRQHVANQCPIQSVENTLRSCTPLVTRKGVRVAHNARYPSRL